VILGIHRRKEERRVSYRRVYRRSGPGDVVMLETLVSCAKTPHAINESGQKHKTQPQLHLDILSTATPFPFESHVTKCSHQSETSVFFHARKRAEVSVRQSQPWSLGDVWISPDGFSSMRWPGEGIVHLSH
jgi:hypothetical protein